MVSQQASHMTDLEAASLMRNLIGGGVDTYFEFMGRHDWQHYACLHPGNGALPGSTSESPR